MMLGIFKVIFFGVLVIALTYGIDFYAEKKAYNKGVCPICGKPIVCVDYNTYNHRHYRCIRCTYQTWVQHYRIDGRRW